MKKICVLLSIILLSISSWSGALTQSGSKSITYEMARKIAIDHAVDNVFADILDAESSMEVIDVYCDKDYYAFYVTAIISPQVCTVDVVVSKETGKASNTHEMNCK